MLEQIAFQNFRCFRNLSLPALSQFTLLTGKNSAGKSSVLEGIFLLMGYSYPDIFEKIRTLRGMPAAADITKLWEPVFHGMDTAQPIRISARYHGVPVQLRYTRDDSFASLNYRQSVQNTFITFTAPAGFSALRYEFSSPEYREAGHLFTNVNGNLAMSTDVPADTNENLSRRAFFSNSLFIKNTLAGGLDDAGLAGWFGELELKGEQQLVIDALRIIDPSIRDVKAIVQQRYIQLYVRTGESMLPVKLTGDGMCKLIYIVLAVLQNPNAVVLIDEIENGFHYSMQEAFWRVLAQAAERSNSQIIATTHSYECIEHAVEGISNSGWLEDFTLYRLDHSVDGNPTAVQYTGDLLKDAVASSMEVR